MGGTSSVCAFRSVCSICWGSCVHARSHQVLLEEIVIISQNIDANLHVVNISTSFDIMKDNFKIVRIIIEDLLGLCAYIHDFFS